MGNLWQRPSIERPPWVLRIRDTSGHPIVVSFVNFLASLTSYSPAVGRRKESELYPSYAYMTRIFPLLRACRLCLSNDAKILFARVICIGLTRRGGDPSTTSCGHAGDR